MSTTTYYKWDKSHRLTTRWQDGGEAHYFTYNQRNMVTGIVDHNGAGDAPRSCVYNALGERVVVKDNSAERTAYWSYDGWKFLRDQELGGPDVKYRHNDEASDKRVGSLSGVPGPFSQFALAQEQSGSLASLSDFGYSNINMSFYGEHLTGSTTLRTVWLQPSGRLEADLSLHADWILGGAVALRDAFVSSGGASGPGEDPHPKDALDRLRAANNGGGWTGARRGIMVAPDWPLHWTDPRRGLMSVTAVSVTVAQESAMIDLPTTDVLCEWSVRDTVDAVTHQYRLAQTWTTDEARSCLVDAKASGIAERLRKNTRFSELGEEDLFRYSRIRAQAALAMWDSPDHNVGCRLPDSHWVRVSNGFRATGPDFFASIESIMRNRDAADMDCTMFVAVGMYAGVAHELGPDAFNLLCATAAPLTIGPGVVPSITTVVFFEGTSDAERERELEVGDWVQFDNVGPCGFWSHENAMVVGRTLDGRVLYRGLGTPGKGATAEEIRAVMAGAFNGAVDIRINAFNAQIQRGSLPMHLLDQAAFHVTPDHVPGLAPQFLSLDPSSGVLDHGQ